VLATLPTGYYGRISVADRGILVSTNGEWPLDPIRGTYQSGSTVVSVYVSSEGLKSSQLRSVMLTAGVGILAMLVAGIFGLFQSQRLARPLMQLAERTKHLGAARKQNLALRSGIPEVDLVAEALEISDNRVTSMLASSRQFAEDA